MRKPYREERNLMSRTWASREEWAKEYNRVDGDWMEQHVEQTVSTELADYGTPEQLAAAVAELREVWRSVGRPLVAANKAAKAVFPMYRVKLKDGPGVDAWSAAWDALTPEAHAVVDAAERIHDRRRRTRAALTDIEAGRMPRLLDVEHSLIRESPHCTMIWNRYTAAAEKAQADYINEITTRVPDDAAWQKELDRRARIERRIAEARAQGAIVHG